ncbi:cache domain-containing sensor histidine kinase [Paenibacillus radicis (ex Xue et al. 2023)]|uniref:histidine kinase n=1 Tax=Paenibacillus radicis (ex Xue et al. 2023) TaxID=2972489 RepID=A0ABT1YC55_9BACL|nr:sensor histidine kinase [Paenibacillus radicis (ex Xue et al. 2023)]MCR8629984.1 sensor histidine kinase [Paenibacillus radicis (ex Xue et al. 2023)]
MFIKKSSLQQKMLISFLCLIVIPLGVFGYVSLTISKQTIEEQTITSNLKTLGLISEKLDIMASDLTAISNIYFSNEDLRKILMQPSGTRTYEERAKKEFLTKMIINFKYAYTWLEYYTSILGLNAFELHTFYDGRVGIDELKKEDWYQEAFRQYGGIIWVSDPSPKLVPTVNEEHFVSAVRVLKDFESGVPLGLLMINVNESFLFQQYAEAMKDYDQLMLVDAKGTIISTTQKSLLHQNIKDTKYYKQATNGERGSFKDEIDGTKMLVTYHNVKHTGWSIIAYTPFDKLFANIYRAQLLIVIVFVIVLFLSILVSYFIANRLSVPIKRLYRSMQKVEMGDLTERTDVLGSDEIGELGRKFNRMVSRIEQLRDRVVVEQEMKRRSELQALQSQINTHFLYNTLASIRYMLLTQTAEKVDSVIVALVKLLKRTLTDENEYISVGEEIENLKNYVYIQKARQDGKLEVEFQIDEGITHAQTLKLLLQPIVENAIFHGIEPKEGNGCISVKGWEEQENLMFEITDNGVGITKLKTEGAADLTEAILSMGSGMGLRNVNHRIVLHFGEEYGLRVFSQEGEGTKVTLKLPKFVKAEELTSL